MKKILMLVLTILCVFSLTGCFLRGNSVAPFAYARYELTGTQVAYHDSIMYGTNIYIFEDETKVPDINDSKYVDNMAGYRLDCDSNSMINISFKRIMGVEEVDGKKATLVEIEKWYYVEVLVKKSSSIYDDNKNVYLNGTKLEKKGKDDSVYDSDVIRIFHFEDCGLKRSNPNGKINGVVNIIEYK